MPENTLTIIARIRSEFPAKFGIPRQSNLVAGLEASIVFEPEYRSFEAVRGLEEFSHLWLLWEFSEARRAVWSPTVRPPRLGGNKRVGVFATRSPFRPNAIGLSSVRLRSIERRPGLGPVIHITGADLLDGTPIFDIKPYIPFTDSHPDACAGFAAEPPDRTLKVHIDERARGILSPEKESTLREILALDPRPSYHASPDRVYGMRYGAFDVKFSVAGEVLIVHGILPVPRED